MRRWLVLLLILAALGSVVGRVVWQRLRGVEVSVVAVTRGRVVEAVYATGRLDTDQRATVRARRSGPLVALLVGPGERVTAGQLLARQDDAEARLAVTRAERELSAASAALLQAQDAAARAEELHRAGLLAENEWIRERERAHELGQRTQALAAAVALAQEQARWVELCAPIAGAVSALHRRSGDGLREGDDVLSIVDLSRAYLRVAVDERDLGRVQPGLPARLVFDAFPDLVLTGAVWRVVPAVDRLTKSADVLVTLPPNPPPLQLDLTATVNIVTAELTDVLVLPRDALRGAGRERAVLKISPQRRAVAASVQVGACDSTHCHLLAGLAPGEEVISAADTVFEGAKVRRR